MMIKEKLHLHWRSLIGALEKFNPFHLVKNPTMFVSLVALVYAAVYTVFDMVEGQFVLNLVITIWIFITIFLSNYAESLSEERVNQVVEDIHLSADVVKVRLESGLQGIKMVDPADLKIGDIIICSAGEIIPVDGEIVSGIATIDESAITGESAPVIRESGGNRSNVIAGTKVLYDEVKIKVLSELGNKFITQMSEMIKGAKRHKSSNQQSLTIFLAALSFLYLVTISGLRLTHPFIYKATGIDLDLYFTIPIYLGILVSFLPITIAGLLSSIAISAIDRLLRKNVVVLDVKALESAGDATILIIDKTGTITVGNRRAIRFLPAKGINHKEMAELAQLASYGDDTIEGRSIVLLSKSAYGYEEIPASLKQIPFSSSSKISGVDYLQDKQSVMLRKGALDSIKRLLPIPEVEGNAELMLECDRISRLGDTPLLLIKDSSLIGAIHLKDSLKGSIKRQFVELRTMGVKTVMVTGDNPLTAAVTAAEAGLDDFLAEATPEDKLNLIKTYQDDGYIVAMVGDGTNDAPALAQADLGLSMRSGTETSRDASHMIDLDNNPSKIIEILSTGRSILRTKGSLTAFSLATDLSKIIAIAPSFYLHFFKDEQGVGLLQIFNFLNLGSVQGAVVSCLAVNALLVFVLFPFATGRFQKNYSQTKALLYNILFFGVGGLILPIVGIKLFDLFFEISGLL